MSHNQNWSEANGFWLDSGGVNRTFRGIKDEEASTFGVVVGKQKLHLGPLTGVFWGHCGAETTPGERLIWTNSNLMIHICNISVLRCWQRNCGIYKWKWVQVNTDIKVNTQNQNSPCLHSRFMVWLWTKHQMFFFIIFHQNVASVFMYFIVFKKSQ